MCERLDASKICYLNLLRFISCLMVFSGHFFYIFIARFFYSDSFHEKNPFLAFLLDFPTFGVMIFFVLSGFLITYSTLVDIQIHNEFSVTNYAKKRLFRIFPPLWISILFEIILCSIINYYHLFGSVTYLLPGDIYVVCEKASLSLNQIMMNILLIPGKTGGFNVSLWSLSYEFFYYIIFAVILIFASMRQLLLLGAIVFLMAMVFVNVNYDYIFITRVLKLSLVWMFGSFIAIMYMKGYLNKIRKEIYFILTAVVSSIFFVEIKFIMHHRMCEKYSYGILISLFICYILTSDHIPSMLSKYLSEGSRYTYTLYLLHFPALLFVFSLAGPSILLFRWYDYLIVYFSMFVIINYLSYYTALIFENRCLMERLTFATLNRIELSIQSLVSAMKKENDEINVL